MTHGSGTLGRFARYAHHWSRLVVLGGRMSRLSEGRGGTGSPAYLATRADYEATLRRVREAQAGRAGRG